MVAEIICDVIIIVGSGIFIWSIYGLFKQDEWEVEEMIDEVARRLWYDSEMH